MTTIAYKDGIMASDSCVSSLGIQVSSICKVLRTSVGALIGQAGDADCRAVFELLDKVKTAKQLPTKQQIAACQTEFEVVIAFPNKDVWMVGCNEEQGRYDGFCYEVKGPFAATGSGWQFAMAAMRCGKTAREAVAIACEFDRSSKLPVHIVSFDPKSKPPLKPKPRPK